MKTVQDKYGNILEVADDTPCHAGKNGQLPIMLDAVEDKKIFDEMAARKAEWDSKASERALQDIIEARKLEYGTVEEQIEYLVENGVDALVTRNNAIKQKHPKN